MKCGVAQGDPLSSYLFCASIDPVLKRLEDESYEVIAYADDILLGVKQEVKASDAQQKALEEFSKIGLSVKCEKTTSNEI